MLKDKDIKENDFCSVLPDELEFEGENEEEIAKLIADCKAKIKKSAEKYKYDRTGEKST